MGVRRALHALHSVLSAPRSATLATGVDSIWHPNWIAVAVLYIFALGFMATDPWFGNDLFAFNHGLFAALLSFVMVSAVAFEWNLLGQRWR